MRAMTDVERALAEEALGIVPVVINAMGRSYPGIKKKLARIDAKSVAYVAVCKATRTYNPEKSKVTTYFSSAIRNALLKELAKHQRLRYDSPNRVPMELAERVTQAQGGQSHKLPAALSALPDHARSLIASRYYAGMSIKEMSISMKVNEKTVRSRLKHAVELVAELLGTAALQPGARDPRCSGSSGARSGGPAAASPRQFARGCSPLRETR
jgi:RNA polymerase sigma factor (sigma-70 family)